MKRGEIYIGLGANLGEREATIAAAIQKIAAVPGIELVRASQQHRTAPWQVAPQPEFINAVIEIDTSTAPEALVELLLRIERGLGRVREPGTRWAARTIDLDLLLYRDRVIREPHCSVPHPRLHERMFALAPLLEIAPNVVIPGVGRAAECLLQLEANEFASERQRMRLNIAQPSRA